MTKKDKKARAQARCAAVYAERQAEEAKRLSYLKPCSPETATIVEILKAHGIFPWATDEDEVHADGVRFVLYRESGTFPGYSAWFRHIVIAPRLTKNGERFDKDCIREKEEALRLLEAVLK